MLNLRPRTIARTSSGSLLGPPALELEHDRVRIGERWSASFAVTGYPREVSRGWLAPLLHAARDADVALHIEAVPPPIAADRLRRQRARLESTRRLEAERGRLPDPTVAAAADDADELASRLARGESKLFRSGLYLSVSASTREELDERTQRLRAICSSLLLHLVPASFRPLEGWLSTLPLGLDRMRLRRAFDTEALAASFPFAAADPQADRDGILYGLAPSGAPVLLDRFARENYNSVLLARSGAGKSYLAKLEALRLLFEGVQVFVIDPEDEYRRLCHAVGGVYLPLAGENAVALNPLDLPAGGGRNTLAERTLFLAELLELLLGRLASEELPALERAVRDCYTGAGIGDEPATHSRPAPLLNDLLRALAADGEVGASVASRLEPYASGSHSSLFAHASSAQPNGQLICFSLRGLPERLKAPALLLCLDAIWRSLEGPLRKRCVLVDEAWLLMREPAGAKFLYRLAKSSRKRWCGLTTVTQDAGDLLASELGQSVIANAATQVLLRQAPQAIDRIGDAFHLSDGERRYLLSCPTGSGLLLLASERGEERVPIRVVASEDEHRLVTSDPAELAEIAELGSPPQPRPRRRRRRPHNTERRA
jgi:type IV secretory pathway VirB4 component